jgi:uncharacterized protein
MGPDALMRVVFDTNVMPSALLLRGVTARLVPLWQKGSITLLLSRDIVQEYLRVLAHPEFQLTKPEIKGLIEGEVLSFAQVIRSTSALKIVKNDPADDKSLECAASGKAQVLFSGDKDLLVLRHFRRVEILSPSQFLSGSPKTK